MDKDFDLQLRGYHLTTAEILYHLPDHPHLLQSFTWQTLDQAPKFPRIHRFLDYWVVNIEGVLHSVRLSHSSLVRPHEILFRDGSFELH
ncbi:MAG: protein usg [Sphingomonadales bacterium]|jgi:uncharacterized protein Usg